MISRRRVSKVKSKVSSEHKEPIQPIKPLESPLSVVGLGKSAVPKGGEKISKHPPGP